MVKKYHPRLYNGNRISVPHALWKMVLKFQEWHRDSVKFVLHHRQSYLSLILSSHRDIRLHATANAKILFTALFRIASTAPSPAAPHIWKFPTPARRPEAVPHEARSLSGTVSMLITPFLADFHRFFSL